MASYKKKFENVTRGEAWGLSEYQEGEPLLVQRWGEGW